MAKVKDRIVAAVAGVYAASNALRASEYGRIYFWQEVGKLADDKLKKAWEARQTLNIISDDGMRALGEGEHVLDLDKRFTVVAKVSKPREGFDLELFIAALVKRHKLDAVKLAELAATCKSKSKPSLSKRVLEVE